jgi:hypothetical protein
MPSRCPDVALIPRIGILESTVDIFALLGAVSQQSSFWSWRFATKLRNFISDQAMIRIQHEFAFLLRFQVDGRTRSAPETAPKKAEKRGSG